MELPSGVRVSTCLKKKQEDLRKNIEFVPPAAQQENIKHLSTLISRLEIHWGYNATYWKNVFTALYQTEMIKLFFSIL